MGNSASKSTRILNKATKLNSTNKVDNVKKQITDNHLNTNFNKKNNNNEPKIFTKRPPQEFERMGDEVNNEINENDKQFSGNKLFEEAVNKGLVKINDNQAKQSFNPNHESIRVLKNRVNVEKQYEGLFIPKNADKPDIPERFLNEEQKRQLLDPNLMKKRLNKTGLNKYGLFDSNKLSDLIIDYKVIGNDEFIKNCKEDKINDENINKLKQFIDDGLINLPTHKVTLNETIDPNSRQIKQKLIIVKDDWVKSIKEDMENEKANKINSKSNSKKDLEVFEQFKMLENLVSKSQISSKKSDGPIDEVETVMNRPKKQLVKEIKKML